MHKTYFYYLRDRIDKKPLVTICLHHESNEGFYRGIAVCSPNDNPNKRIGRAIAYGRVKQAIEKKRDSSFVYRNEAVNVFSRVGSIIFHCKSTNDPALTPLEIKLIKGEIK